MMDDYFTGRHLDEEQIEGPLPMLLNLSDFGRPEESMIGHAFVYQIENGRKRIEIILNEETSKALTHLTDIFQLKGIGFAGVMRKSEDGG